MAKIAAMPSMDIVNSLRGVLDFYVWCNLVIVRKWPKAPDRSRNDLVMSTAEKFKYVNQAASTLTADIIQPYKDIASQTGLSWKDWMTRLYINPGTNVHLIEG